MRYGNRTRARRWLTAILTLALVFCMVAPAPAMAAGITSKKPKINATKSAYVNGKVDLRWGKVSGAAKYEVYRSTAKSGTYKKFATVTKNSLKKKADGTYWYKVRAVKGSKKSKFSAPVRVFSANARITDAGVSAASLWLRVLVSNKTKKQMTFLGTDMCNVYLLNKSGKVVASSNLGVLSTGTDPYGISYGFAKEIKGKKSASLYVNVYDSTMAMAYGSDPDAYSLLVTMSFYPGGGDTSTSDIMALAAGMKASQSAVAVKQ
ncbi:MAG: cache domain-containing protein [Clostridia bacterium]|nr:cache domain-containing protein [Clostridia bacterium]